MHAIRSIVICMDRISNRPNSSSNCGYRMHVITMIEKDDSRREDRIVCMYVYSSIVENVHVKSIGDELYVYA